MENNELSEYAKNSETLINGTAQLYQQTNKIGNHLPKILEILRVNSEKNFNYFKYLIDHYYPELYTKDDIMQQVIVNHLLTRQLMLLKAEHDDYPISNLIMYCNNKIVVYVWIDAITSYVIPVLAEYNVR